MFFDGVDVQMMPRPQLPKSMLKLTNESTSENLWDSNDALLIEVVFF